MILPRIRQSIRKRGLLRTLGRCLLGPYDLIRTYLDVCRNYRKLRAADAFDVAHGVETSKRVHPTDLAINSPNWINAVGYWPTPTKLAQEAIASLPIKHEQFTFIDIGSGKGRVLLIASEFPFTRILGIEFSPELHAIAEENIRNYKSATQKCHQIRSVCQDFTQFELPPGPLVLYVYNPAAHSVMTTFAHNTANSLLSREVWVIYVTPTYGKLFESAAA
jgi:SAM-dependent methyltransferase